MYKLYLNQFSYVNDSIKLARAFICEKCGAKFNNNRALVRHIPILYLHAKRKSCKTISDNN